MQHVLIAGGSGLVGSRLCELAKLKGHKVSILSRSNSNKEGFIHWNPNKGEIDKTSLTDIDYLVNLSGENIAKKAWSKKRKKELRDSRIISTEFLAEQFNSINHQLKAVVNASAIGFYKSSLTEEMTEDENPSDGFMAELCNNWEQAAQAFQKNNIRTVIIRIGLVLSNIGGAYKAMATPAKFGIGSYLGNGKQKMPWVHIDDLCNMILFALENENMKGVYNTTVPNAPSNKTFTKALLKSFHSLNIMPPTPAFILKMVLGERSEILLNSYNPSAEKLLNTGFQFEYTDLTKTFSSLK
ncbi:MAG: TIGR01777 family protein [Bacteroidia bacterium]|nr:TIGR01777 family protein [Bacteroidia bacterium]